MPIILDSLGDDAYCVHTPPEIIQCYEMKGFLNDLSIFGPLYFSRVPFDSQPPQINKFTIPVKANSTFVPPAPPIQEKKPEQFSIPLSGLSLNLNPRKS
jgi:hypothetical protein